MAAENLHMVPRDNSVSKTQSYLIPHNLLLKTLSSPGTCGQWLPEVLLRERIWKELLSPVIQGSLESSCPAPPATVREGHSARNALPECQDVWHCHKTRTYRTGEHHQLPESEGTWNAGNSRKEDVKPCYPKLSLRQRKSPVPAA